MEMTDKFSWRRVWMLWRLYLPSLRKQLWVFPIASFALSMIYVIAAMLNPDSDAPAITFTIGISIMYFFAPVTLTRRDYRPVSDQLPVLTSEKITFLALYFMLVTMALTYGVQIIVFSLSSVVFPQFGVQMSDAYSTAMANAPSPSIMALSYINAMALPSLTLMGVLLAKRNRVLKGVLSCLGGYLAIIIVSAITAVIMVMPKIDELDSHALMEERFREVFGVVVWVTTGITAIMLAVSWTFIYKKVKRGGF